MLEERILPTALGPVDLGATVVEVGPGAGFTTEVLLRTTGYVTAVEIDPVLAAGLRRRLAGRPVAVVEGDARRTELPGASFTGAASFNVLHHVSTDEDQDLVLVELRRLLRPGGRLVLADGVPRDDIRAFHEGDVYHPVDPATLPARLDRAGFGDVRVARDEVTWYCWAEAPAA